MKPEEFEKEICDGTIGFLYYLYGDEPYLVERGANKLLAKAVSPEFREFNLTVFYGGEAKGEAIGEVAQTLPMFAERRVVLVRKCGSLSADALEVLAGYVQDPSPTTCLIFQGEKVDLRKKFFVELKKQGRLVEFKRPYENQLAYFVREEAASHGKRVDAAAAEMLVYLVGNNLQELATQVEKVVLYVGARQLVKVDDVRAAVSDTKVDSVFDLANALGAKNLVKALRSLHTLIRDGESPLMILAMIVRHFRQLWRIKELVAKKVSSPEIGKSVGINPYFIRGLLEQSGNHSLADLRSFFELFYSIDLALKSSGGKPTDLLERMALQICGTNGRN